MEQHLITASPNISGNVGSCTTQTITITAERLSNWKVNLMDITTNSCTGEVSKYTHYAYTPTFFIGIAASVAIGLILFGICFRVFTDN